MSARLSKEALETRLQAEFGQALQPARDPWGTGPLPVVRPGDEAELLELLAFARAEDQRLLPLGSGTKLGRKLPPERIDFLAETRAFGQVSAFEPGDGTLTAGGGAALDELATLCRSGGRTIVPEVAPGATLGGVIASAETGVDRLLRGPVREHVLGLRVLLSSGRASRSGGRLVKNVAGYDLHRLHTGGWGGLGFILEATLRLFPDWKRELRLEVPVTDLRAVLAAASSLRAAPIAPKRIHATLAAKGDTRLFVDLAGREDLVRAELDVCLELFPECHEVALCGPEPRPGLVLQALPSRAEALMETALHLHAELPAAWEARLDFDPLLARAAFALTSARSLDVAEITKAGFPDGVQRVWPPNGTPKVPSGALELTRRIEATLDATHSFARD